MASAEATILIPNYRTLELTTLCLRLLRKHTPPGQVRVIVIDNHSQDASVAYLRRVAWIDLIEREPAPDDTPSLSHARALDSGLARVETPYVISFHTDTFVRTSRWLEVLRRPFQEDPQVAGVGSWKLEPPPGLAKRLGKTLEHRWRRLRHRLTGNTRKAQAAEEQMHSGYYRLFDPRSQPDQPAEGGLYFLRSHCAMYRMDLVRRFGLSFTQGSETAGKGLHQALVERGYRMVFLPVAALAPHVLHINHATMALHPELGSSRKNVASGRRRIRHYLNRMQAEAILQDTSLDR